MSQQKETIAVLGGGIAGLAAAYTLIQKGYKVVLFEARDYYGGRIKSIELEGTNGKLEAGANWVEASIHHQNCKNYLAQFAELSTSRINFFDRAIYKDSLLDKALTEKLIDYCNSLFYDRIHLENSITEEEAFEKTYAARPHELPFSKNFIKKSYISIFFNSDRGVAFNEIKNNLCIRAVTKQLREYEVESWYESYFAELVKNGYERLPLGLINQLEKNPNFQGLLQHQVVHVDSHDPKILISTKNQSKTKLFEADSVISTLPSGVLQKHAEDLFTPKLPQPKLEALKRIKQAYANKVFLIFSERFWDNSNPLLFFHSDHSESLVEVLNLAHPSINQGNGLVVWFNDHAAKDLSQNEMLNCALLLIEAHFGHQLPELINSYVTNWSHDPYAYGAWTGSGAITESELDKQSLADFIPESRIWFAGEYTSAYGGSVHGAFISGLATAESVDDFYYKETDLIFDLLKTQNSTLIEQTLKHLSFIPSFYKIAHESKTIYPLQLCLEHNNKVLFEYLIQHGVNFTGCSKPDINDYPTLIELLKSNPIKVIKFFKYYFKVNPEIALKELKQFVFCFIKAKVQPFKSLFKRFKTI